jgi:hypothetical protein
MAQATITVTTTAGATRILLTSSIKRIRTKDTGTEIFFGSPQGGGKSPRSVSVTQSLATVVALLGGAIIPLTVITNGIGVVNYFPLTAIKDIRTNVASPINATIAIGAAGGDGEIVDNFNVSETAAAVAELLNDNTASASKFLEVAWDATPTIDLAPYINATNKLFINFAGATQATTALTFTGIIPPNMDIQLLFNANTTLTVNLNAVNVIAVVGKLDTWTNTKAISGAFNLFEITAIGDNVTDKLPVLITKHTLA